jgi:hypothetical protein
MTLGFAGKPTDIPINEPTLQRACMKLGKKFQFLNR